MKVFSSPAVKKALDEVIDLFQQETAVEVRAVFEPTSQLLGRIEAREPFDVMIAVSGSFASLGPIIDGSTLTSVARAGIGVAVKDDAPAPDISTAESFIKTIRGAKSVAYSGTGASGAYFETLLEDLGLNEEVGSRATVVKKGYVAEAVVDGTADIAIQQLSELLFVPQAHIVGPLPSELQHYTEFSAAVSASSTRPAEAESFVSFLSSHAAQAKYLQTMLELPTVPAK
ncbi:substrate-binding domain-containing protein [Pseudarthrobacter sp. NIBRBAC000502771]|uniref:substrate-binding domain-containing protein n=1 Tax=Pseudarthrobacter sp. NIBRBAC000502771 TaxID=2590774 RepID=UPI001AEFA582|nr:substrate-binding domain-containing protein [Pseudarthrobacter sp. NIBRBAC000502771]